MKYLNHIITLFLIFIFFGVNAQISDKFSDVLIKNIELNKNNSEYTVWIFMTDKGSDLKTKIKTAENNLSERSLQRRRKLIKVGSLTDYYDIPVEENYINQITPHINKLRHQSKWLNAISAEVSREKLEQIASFDFVKKIDIVRKGKSNKKNIANERIVSIDNSKSIMYNLNYGSSLTQLEQINVPTVHDMGFSGNGIIICVLDAGFNNLEHQAFSNMDITHTYDFVNGDENVDDEGDMGSGDHGTMTLSTIGGFYEGQLIGPAYGATYLLAKTENTESETPIEEDNWVAGAEWADELGADITSTSLGYTDWYTTSDLDGNTATITIAADIAASRGILVVNSAGNSGGGTTTISAPADGDSVLSVGAVDATGIRTSFSSVGPTADGRIKPEVMAMGSYVYVANPPSGNNYTHAEGTSFSCPLTAGAAALLWEMVPEASNMDIFEALKMTANNADAPNNQYGWGIIDIYAAYEYLALPQISHTPLPDSENLSGPYTADVEISSNYDLVNESPKLYFRRNNNSWTELIMTSSKETGNYSADIPGNGNTAEYDYYITAENTAASVSLPENAPTSFFTFNVEPDNVAPEIIHNSIAEYYKNLWSQAQVIAEITDNTEIDLENTYVSWKLNGEEQDNLSFFEIEENIYSSYFPYLSLSLDDLIEYKIVAQDNSQAQNTSTLPEAGYQSFNITDRISFEQNQFSHNWTFSGAKNWFISSGEHQNGSYSSKSGNIDDNESSSISITFTTDETGDISFYKKVSSEGSWDFLKFYINDDMEEEWSGEVSWSQETYSINPGTYTLQWTFEKDVGVSTGDDCAWIDNITFPGVTTTYSVIFNVDDGSNPVEGANIIFRSQNNQTNGNGQATFNNIAPANNIPYTITKDGFEDYTGTVTVTNEDAEENVTLSVTGIDELISTNGILLYPNPADNFIKIQAVNIYNKINEVIIYNISGQIQKNISNFTNNEINISNLKPGLYICKIISTNQTTILKFIITR